MSRPGNYRPQNKKILVGGKIGERVEHKHRVNAVVCYIVLHAAQIVPGIKEVNLRKSLRQEGSQGVGVGIPDDQHLGAIHLWVLDDAQGLAPPQEVGVFILHF